MDLATAMSHDLTQQLLSSHMMMAMFIVGVTIGMAVIRLHSYVKSKRQHAKHELDRWQELCLRLRILNSHANNEIFELLQRKEVPVLANIGATMACTSSTALHEVARSAYTSQKLLAAVVKLAMEQNPDKTHHEIINCRNGKGATPLHECCFAGTFNNIVWLVKNGADINATTQSGRTVIHEVLSSPRTVDNAEIIKFLLEKGAPLKGRTNVTLPVLGSAIYRFVTQSAVFLCPKLKWKKNK